MSMESSQLRHFRAILRRFERVTNGHLRNCCCDVTLAQCLVLMEVDQETRSTVGQLASRLRLDDSTLSRTIDGLVRKGLLERMRDDRDRRQVWIRLSPAGEKVCRAIHEQSDATYQAIFERIPASERETVIQNFEILVQAFLDSEEASSDAGRSPTEGTHEQERLSSSRPVGAPLWRERVRRSRERGRG